jgi:hypothetical protein
MELAPCLVINGTGCQGVKGPLPSAFLDKLKKNCPKDNPALPFSKINFPARGEQPRPYIVIIFSDSILL